MRVTILTAEIYLIELPNKQQYHFLYLSSRIYTYNWSKNICLLFETVLYENSKKHTIQDYYLLVILTVLVE